MCGRFLLSQPDRALRRYEVPRVTAEDLLPRYNVAPSQLIVAIVAGPDGRRVRMMRWGFRPAWMTALKQAPPINARAETLADSKLFRGALVRNRCLIPADGFYEWKTEGTRKRPYVVRLADEQPFAFAGLYTPGDRDDLENCAIVTTKANALMAAIHTRMPVILTPEDAALWLDPRVREPQALLSLLKPFPAEQMLAYPVSPLVGSPRNEGPQLLLPLEP